MQRLKTCVALSAFGVTALLTSGCTTAGGERPGFWDGIRQTVGAAAMATGLAGKNDSLATQGAEMLDKGLGNTPPK